MGTTNDTITATSTASNVNQTITFYTADIGNQIPAIILNGVARTNGQTMSLACGTYSLTADLHYATSGGSSSSSVQYGFDSWSNSGGSIANTGVQDTTYTVNGPGSITLNAKPIPFIQDFTLAQCQSQASSSSVTVVDSRDGSDYTVRYINGNCWMTQNLRIAGGTTLTSTYSNVSSSYTIPTTPLEGTSYSYTAGQVQDSGNTTTGYWYNFCAASAGTNCQSSTQYDTTYDICPKGWRLPTNSEFSTITGTSYISAFSPVTGRGYWWSSTVYNSSSQYCLNYNGSSNLRTSFNGRGFGNYVRCIRSS